MQVTLTDRSWHESLISICPRVFRTAPSERLSASCWPLNRSQWCFPMAFFSMAEMEHSIDRHGLLGFASTNYWSRPARNFVDAQVLTRIMGKPSSAAMLKKITQETPELSSYPEYKVWIGPSCERPLPRESQRYIVSCRLSEDQIDVLDPCESWSSLGSVE